MSWDNPEDYRYTSTHTVRDWGWEFIRRSAEYKTEWGKALSNFDKKKKDGTLFKDMYPLASTKELMNQRPSSKDEGLEIGLKAGAADAVCA